MGNEVTEEMRVSERGVNGGKERKFPRLNPETPTFFSKKFLYIISPREK